MKELVIASGKGGTGKTSISGALAYLAPHKVLADCDVDAANFHLITGSTMLYNEQFTAGFEPSVDSSKCMLCGRCTELCRFRAINNGIINQFSCEGCGVCAHHCPHQAIAMVPKSAGIWKISNTRFGHLVHAELGIAIENSGKLVSKVRQEAKKIALEQKAPLIVTDGPPGIGCPTIAAVTGSSLVLMVAEPSVSGMHDLSRLYQITKHFGVKAAVCINKIDIDTLNTHTIIAWCHKENIPVIGEIPYSDVFRHANQQGRTVMDMSDDHVKDKLVELWYNVTKLLDIDHTERVMNIISRRINSLMPK